MLLRQLRAFPRTLKKKLKATAKKMLRRLPGIERLIVLGDRMALLEQSLGVLRASMQSKLMLQENRIRSLAEHRSPSGPGEPHAASSLRALSVAGLEFMLAHSRLPAPPCRILDLGGLLAHGGVDLSSLGYDICREQESTHEANAWNAVLCRVGEALHGADEVENCKQLIAGAMYGLRTGGRLILSAPLADGEPVPAWIDQLNAREVIHARRQGNIWTFDAVLPNRRGHGEALILAVVEKS